MTVSRPREKQMYFALGDEIIVPDNHKPQWTKSPLQQQMHKLSNLQFGKMMVHIQAMEMLCFPAFLLPSNMDILTQDGLLVHQPGNSKMKKKSNKYVKLS